MALKRILETDFGHTVEYWRITKVGLNFKDKVCECVIAGYKDEATRDTIGKKPLANRNMTIGGDDFTFKPDESVNIVELLYAKMKQEDFFQNAEDV